MRDQTALGTLPASAVAYLVLFVIGLTVVVRSGQLVSSHLVLLVLAALVFDNAIIGLGNTIGEGPALAALSVPRFWLHALVTPLLVIVAWHTMVRAGVRWARRRWALALVVALVLLVVGIAIMVRTRWPWLLVGTVLMIIGSGVPIPVASGAITNAFELILLTSILATVVHQERQERHMLAEDRVADPVSLLDGTGRDRTTDHRQAGGEDG